MSSELINFLGLFILITGFVIGLGAVTVIDIHGFLGRKSKYWTEATTRTHKVTKPLIWTGIILTIIGGILFYRNEAFTLIPSIQASITLLLILNGCFLSFKVSPHMIQRESNGKADQILSKAWQRKIMFSMLISDLGWWTNLLLLVIHLSY